MVSQVKPSEVLGLGKTCGIHSLEKSYVVCDWDSPCSFLLQVKPCGIGDWEICVTFVCNLKPCMVGAKAKGLPFFNSFSIVCLKFGAIRFSYFHRFNRVGLGLDQYICLIIKG